MLLLFFFTSSPPLFRNDEGKERRLRLADPPLTPLSVPSRPGPPPSSASRDAPTLQGLRRKRRLGPRSELALPQPPYVLSAQPAGRRRGADGHTGSWTESGGPSGTPEKGAENSFQDLHHSRSSRRERRQARWASSTPSAANKLRTVFRSPGRQRSVH